MMTATIGIVEERRIRDWAKGCGSDVVLSYATAGHTMDEAFVAFVEALCDLAPNVKAKRDGDVQVPRPTLFAGPRVAYQALPLDRELDPFLNFLGDPAGFAQSLAPAVRRQLEQLPMPAPIKIYITAHCPFCPSVVATLLGFAAASEQVRVTVIDGERFADAAQEDRILSAPTTILDDQFRWTGAPDAAELAAMMVDRDPAGLGGAALKSMIEEGQAEAVAQMMVRRGLLFPAFVALLADARWSVRLGAMVAFESLAETDATLAGSVADPLLATYAAAGTR